MREVDSNRDFSARHPAYLATLLVAGACILAAATYRIADFDFWQHLWMGRLIWATHQVPSIQLSTWPQYGQPDINSSWGFEALLWPAWNLFGSRGLFVWDWATTLAAFGLCLITARVLGARGLSPLLVLVLCALSYRQRVQARPETLACVLLALEIWLLEQWRTGRHNFTGWLVPLAWVRANSHISYALGIVVQLIYAVLGGGHESLPRKSRAPGVVGGTRGFAPIIAASVAISFLNPFGWRALAQPFDFFLNSRREGIYRTIGELLPTDWGFNARNGLAVLVAGWLALQLWKWRKGRFDPVEASLCVILTALMISARRAIGFWAVGAAPFLGRDLSEWLHERSRRRRPALPWARAAGVASACVLLSLPELARPEFPLGIGLDRTTYPEAACDFVAHHAIRGRAFNQYEFGGYMLWRFWPDRDRLPFMDIHQAGTTLDQARYLAALGSSAGWRDLDRVHRFDFALLRRIHALGDSSLDALDADPSFALVFVDDAAALYLRRDQAHRRLIDSLGYRFVPGGKQKLGGIGVLAVRDSAVRRSLAAELDRMARESPLNSSAHGLSAHVAALDGDLARAREELRLAYAVDPLVPRYHERLGQYALREGDARTALQEFKRERGLGNVPGLDQEIAAARESLRIHERGAAAR